MLTGRGGSRGCAGTGTVQGLGLTRMVVSHVKEGMRLSRTRSTLCKGLAVQLGGRVPCPSTACTIPEEQGAIERLALWWACTSHGPNCPCVGGSAAAVWGWVTCHTHTRPLPSSVLLQLSSVKFGREVDLQGQILIFVTSLCHFKQSRASRSFYLMPDAHQSSLT